VHSLSLSFLPHWETPLSNNPWQKNARKRTRLGNVPHICSAREENKTLEQSTKWARGRKGDLLHQFLKRTIHPVSMACCLIAHPTFSRCSAALIICHMKKKECIEKTTSAWKSLAHSFFKATRRSHVLEWHIVRIQKDLVGEQFWCLQSSTSSLQGVSIVALNYLNIKQHQTAELSTFTFNLLSTKSPPVIDVKILKETSTWYNKNGKKHLQKTVII